MFLLVRPLKGCPRSTEMTDIFSKKKRSQIMSAVKNKDSKIEVEFRKNLWEAGLRYRKNPRGYFGKPDIVLNSRKVVIFVDSCFWHGCKKHCRIPNIRKKYWAGKIARNEARDKEVSRHYKRKGWRIFRIWEHEINKIQNSNMINKILRIKIK